MCIYTLMNRHAPLYAIALLLAADDEADGEDADYD
jgi:hypothetical protein